jgi:long-chain fatty acid transport protein
MKIQDTRAVIAWVAAGLICTFTGHAVADGYRNPPTTAAGIGKSGVNRVFVGDASAISYNPANLSFQTNASVVVDLVLAKTEITYDSRFDLAGDLDSNDEWAVLPNLYVALPSDIEGVTIGLGVTTPYGQGIDWDAADLYSPLAFVSLYEAKISLINFNPTVAFEVCDGVSIGLGADIYYSELEFNALTGLAAGGAATGMVTAEGDDISFGGNVGVSWQIDDRQRMIFTYQSEITLDYEGTLDATGTPLVDSDFAFGVTYPNILAAGYGVELTDSIRVEANIEWLEWSSTETQVADLGVNGALALPQHWDNTFTLGLGADWQIDEHWVVRAGYAFIETPIPDSTIAALLPDADRHAISFGAGYTLDGHSVDVAYTFSIYDDRENTASGAYDIASDLVGLTYSYEF